MTYPDGVTTRAVEWGIPIEFVGGVGWQMTVAVTPSVPKLVWASTGDVVIAGQAKPSSPGATVTIDLPVTDQTGWIDPSTGFPIDPTDNPTHAYTASCTVIDGSGTVQAQYVSNKFIIPTGDGSTLDADLFLTYAGPSGTLVSLPDVWSALVDQTITGVGTTTTGDYGTDAEVTVSGDPGERVLDFVIPSGPQGDSAYEVAVNDGFEGTEDEWLASLIGPANSLSIGTVSDDAPGGSGSVTITGDAPEQVLDFVLPTTSEAAAAAAVADAWNTAMGAFLTAAPVMWVQDGTDVPDDALTGQFLYDDTGQVLYAIGASS